MTSTKTATLTVASLRSSKIKKSPPASNISAAGVTNVNIVVVIDINTYWTDLERKALDTQTSSRADLRLSSSFNSLSSCNYRVSFACKDNQLFFLFNVLIDINDNYLDFLITHYG